MARRLRGAGLRATRPRIAVLEVLDDASARGEHLLVNDIVRQARARAGGLSVQTVYDCLEAFTRIGAVRRVEPAGSAAMYESRVDNHHHLVCRDCGTTVDVDCVVGEAPCLQPVEDRGFVVDEAEVTFWGTCPACRAAHQPHGEEPTQ